LQVFHFTISLSHGLEYVSELESADSSVIEERREDKVRSRRHNEDSVFLGIELAGENIAWTVN